MAAICDSIVLSDVSIIKMQRYKIFLKKKASIEKSDNKRLRAVWLKITSRNLVVEYLGFSAVFTDRYCIIALLLFLGEREKR